MAPGRYDFSFGKKKTKKKGGGGTQLKADVSALRRKKGCEQHFNLAIQISATI